MLLDGGRSLREQDWRLLQRLAKAKAFEVDLGLRVAADRAASEQPELTYEEWVWIVLAMALSLVWGVVAAL